MPISSGTDLPRAHSRRDRARKYAGLLRATNRSDEAEKLEARAAAIRDKKVE